MQWLRARLCAENRADLAAWGTVQKVSNLILNINVYMEDVRAKKMVFVKSVDIRGNTDELWQRGLDYLLQHYLFDAPEVLLSYNVAAFADEESCIRKIYFLACEGLRWICQNQVTLHRGFWRLSRV